MIKLVGTEAASLALRLSLPPYSRDCIPRINLFFPPTAPTEPLVCLPALTTTTPASAWESEGIAGPRTILQARFICPWCFLSESS